MASGFSGEWNAGDFIALRDLPVGTPIKVDTDFSGNGNVGMIIDSKTVTGTSAKITTGSTVEWDNRYSWMPNEPIILKPTIFSPSPYNPFMPKPSLTTGEEAVLEVMRLREEVSRLEDKVRLLEFKGKYKELTGEDFEEELEKFLEAKEKIIRKRRKPPKQLEEVRVNPEEGGRKLRL